MSEFGGPNPVHVVNPSAQDVYERIKRREANLQARLEESAALVVEYHAPTGMIVVVSDIGYYEKADDALLLVGVDAGTEHECQIIVPAATLQIVFRVVRADHRRPRKRIGFSGPKDEEDTPIT
jgi:hypothetical protein